MGHCQTSEHREGKGSYHQVGLVRGQFGAVPEDQWLDFIAKTGFDGWEEASWELDLSKCGSDADAAKYAAERHAKAKSRGQQDYGIDVRLPGMLTAVVARPPVFGAKLKSMDDSAAQDINGVKSVQRVPTDRGCEGVAIVADGYWPAKQGRDALKVEWDTSAVGKPDTTALLAQYRELAAKPGPARDRVVALGPEDGHVIWERPLDEKAETPPACWRDTLLVGLQTSRLLVLDRSSGEPLSAWELPGPPTAGPEVWGDQVTLGFADGTIRCYDLSASARASSNPPAIRIPR